MAVAALLLFVLTRSLMGHPPEYDELLHVLSARGVIATGQPVIDSGIYPRAEWFTRVVAFFISDTSDELVSGRWPALIAGMALVALIGGWVGRKAGWLAGIAAAAILILAPITIHQSVMVRFYTLHTLLVTGLFIMLYEAFLPKVALWIRALALVAAFALAQAAFHFHDLTLIALGAGILAVVSVLVLDQQARYWPWVCAHKLVTTVLVATMGIGALYAMVTLGIIDQLRGTPPAWSEDRATYYGFYFGAFGFHMPFVWPLFPLLAISALIGQKRLALFALVIVVVGLAANSIASQKAMRYVFYLFPMICVLWGIGFAHVIAFFVRALQQRTSLNTAWACVLVLAAFGLSVANTHEFKRGLKLVLQKGELDEALPVLVEPDWVKSRPALTQFVEAGDTLVVNSGVKGIYAFGRYDYELNRNVVAETDTRDEFGLDRRTGRQVIGSVESVASVIAGADHVLFVLEKRMLNVSSTVNAEVVQLLESTCSSIELPSATRLAAWRCSAST